MPYFGGIESKADVSFVCGKHTFSFKIKEIIMRKSFIAMACVSALAAAGAVSAADVQLYGAIDSYVRVNHQTGKTDVSLNSGGASASYFGFQGTEDLSNGMQVAFKLESGYLSDNGTYAQSFAGNTSRIFHRESWVALRGPWGHIGFGRQYTPHFLTWAMSDVNGLSLGTASSPFFYPHRTATMGGDDPTIDDLVRRSNSIFYATPNMNGFTGYAFASLSENDGKSSTRGNVYNLALQYVNGPLFLMGSALYQKFDIQNHPDLGANVVAFPDGQVGIGDAGRNKRGGAQYYELAASYDFGFTKPAIQLEYKKGNGAEAVAINDPSMKVKFGDVFIGQIGTTTPMFGGRLNTTAAYLHDFDNDDADGYSVGIRYDYNLSKRTMLYVGIEALWNDKNAQRSIEAGPDSSWHVGTTKPGHDVQQFFMGINHKF